MLSPRHSICVCGVCTGSRRSRCPAVSLSTRQGFPTESGLGWPPGYTRDSPVSVSQSCGVRGTCDDTQVFLCLLGSQTQVLGGPQALFLLTKPFLQRVSELYLKFLRFTSFIICVWGVCLHVCLWPVYPVTGVVNWYPGCWDSNWGPLKERPMLLITEPPL